MQIMSLGYLGFAGPRYEEWLTFGPEVFGFGLGPRGPDGSVTLRMDDRHHRVSIHPGEIDELRYIGWELRNRLVFADALKELDEKGVDYAVADQALLQDRRVSEMAWFHDPAGYRHEIFHSQEFETLSFLPGRPITGFVADDMGVGHVVLAVPEVGDDIRDFVLNVLGLKIFAGYRTPLFDGKILGLEFYYSGNGRNHCLGYVPAGDKRGVTHWAAEVKSLDDVGRAFDICERKEVPIKMTLGRTHVDEAVSFYVRTPTGVEFEYIVGGSMVPDDDKHITLKPTSAFNWGHKVLLKGWGSTVRPVEDAAPPHPMHPLKTPAGA